MSFTTHRLINCDARDLSFLEDESLHLVVTSPPYWTSKGTTKTRIYWGTLPTTKHSWVNWRKFGITFIEFLYRVAGLCVWLAMYAWHAASSVGTLYFLCMPTFA